MLTRTLFVAHSSRTVALAASTRRMSIVDDAKRAVDKVNRKTGEVLAEAIDKADHVVRGDHKNPTPIPPFEDPPEITVEELFCETEEVTSNEEAKSSPTTKDRVETLAQENMRKAKEATGKEDEVRRTK